MPRRRLGRGAEGAEPGALNPWSPWSFVGRRCAAMRSLAEDHTMLALAAAGLPVVDQVNVDVSDASCPKLDIRYQILVAIRIGDRNSLQRPRWTLCAMRAVGCTSSVLGAPF